MPIHETMAREILTQAQDHVRAQQASAETYAARLTLVLGQSVALALPTIAALGYETLHPSAGPLSGAFSVGLSVGAAVWVSAAVLSVVWLVAEPLGPASFTPQDLWQPEIIYPTDMASGLVQIALASQNVIEANTVKLRDLELRARVALFLLPAGLVGGLLALFAASWRSAALWSITLYAGLAVVAAAGLAGLAFRMLLPRGYRFDLAARLASAWRWLNTAL